MKVVPFFLSHFSCSWGKSQLSHFPGAPRPLGSPEAVCWGCFFPEQSQLDTFFREMPLSSHVGDASVLSPTPFFPWKRLLVMVCSTPPGPRVLEQELLSLLLAHFKPWWVWISLPQPPAPTPQPWPGGLLDLSSLTRDWPQAPAVKAPSLNHWTTREVPSLFHFWILWIMLLWTFMYKFLCGQMFSVLLGVYVEVESLGHMIAMLNFLRNHQLFFKAAPSYSPSSSVSSSKFSTSWSIYGFSGHTF